MKAAEPGELPELFLHALNSGDVDSVVALYELVARQRTAGLWLVVIDGLVDPGLHS